MRMENIILAYLCSFSEGLGLIDMQDEGPVPPNLLIATGFPGFPDGGLDAGARDIPQMFWGGPVRGTRRSLRGTPATILKGLRNLSILQRAILTSLGALETNHLLPFPKPLFTLFSSTLVLQQVALHPNRVLHGEPPEASYRDSHMTSCSPLSTLSVRGLSISSNISSLQDGVEVMRFG